MLMTITINNTDYDIPQSWNELPLRDQLAIYNIIQSSTGSVFLPSEVMPVKRIAILTHLMRVDDQLFIDWKTDRQREYGDEEGALVFYSELASILTATDFLFDIHEQEDGTLQYEVSLSLTKCPWPVLRLKQGKKRAKFYAPADGLKNITLHELAISFTLFERYLQSNDMAHAERLIATIYRPSKPKTAHNKRSNYEGDRRLPLYKHESTIDLRQPLFAKIPKMSKQLIVFWFACCRHQIIKSYPNIFKRESDMQVKGERVGNDYGWGGLLLSLSGGLVNLEQISSQPYENGLVYLSYLEDERKKAEMKKAFKP